MSCDSCFKLQKKLDELEDAYNIAMGEINNLRCKLGYNKEGLISPYSQKTSKTQEDSAKP